MSGPLPYRESPVNLTAVAVLATATPLGATALYEGLVVQADLANTAAVYLGGPGVTTANGLALSPGASFSFPQADPSTVYAVAAAAPGQSVRVMGLGPKSGVSGP